MMGQVIHFEEKDDISSAFETPLLEMLEFFIHSLKMEMEALLPMMSENMENECEMDANNAQRLEVLVEMAVGDSSC